MSAQSTPSSKVWGPLDYAILIACFAVAALSARPYAGSWNDGSRLATVESLVDRHTLHIEHSIFVDVPASLVAAGLAPYAPGDPTNNFGTRDKLLIDGHYYSDKPAIISFLMAIPYWLWQWLGGPTFAARPDLVCWFLTFLVVGTSYAVATLCLYRMSGLLGWDTPLRITVTASFALATIAIVYLRSVNNHIVLTAVFAALLLNLMRLREASGRARWARLFAAGALCGIGVNLDLGLALPLIAFLLALVAYQQRSFAAVAVVGLAAAPWVVGQVAVNYAIGGVLKPINMVPEYLQWPGSPFDASNLTGVAQQSLTAKIIYLLGLAFGKHGFLQYNLPLLLLLPAAFLLAWGRVRISAELSFGFLWALGGGLMYGLLSNNYGGACCSIRWFVPFLVPFFVVLGALQQQLPEWRGDFLLLSALGALLAIALWLVGPFSLRMNPAYWPIQGAALLTWGIYRWRKMHHSERQTATILSPASA
jgi:hypothetical protein